MHEKVNKLLLVRDIFMHEVHSRLPGFTCSTWKLFNKHKKRIEKFTEMVDSQYFYQKELDKACFQDDMAYGEFKDLPLKNDFWHSIPW